MLSRYMKCKNTPNTIFLHGTVNKTNLQSYHQEPHMWLDQMDLETLLVTKHDQNKINTNQTLRVYLYLFLNKFGIKPKNELIPNYLKILCKLPHDKLVYQNKFHNFWNYTVAYKNYGNCIYQLIDWIFEH